MFNSIKQKLNSGFIPLEKKLNLRDKFNFLTGFTLIELLMASVIFILTLGIIYSMYFSGLEIWETGRTQADLQAKARLALNYMAVELRNAARAYISIPALPNNHSITFYLPADLDGDGLITSANGDIEWDTLNPIQYQYMPTQNEIRRLDNSGQRILARDVADVQFFDIDVDPTLSINELRITLSLERTTLKQRDISISLSSITALRN